MVPLIAFVFHLNGGLVLYMHDLSSIIGKKQKVWIDTLNRNAIISLAMIYALWQSKRQDLLDLISPFVLYAVSASTDIGQSINTEKITRYMESEFGYKSFQPAVVERVLTREASSSAQRKIEKINGRFYLKCSLSDLNETFSHKRMICKEQSDAVTTALASYLNENWLHKKTVFTQALAENLLLSFFERQGGPIVLSVEDLRQIHAKNNEIDYHIARFILAENEKHSYLMDYLVELVKGYFVTTALYMQAENPNITKASFSDVVFFLDTRILLAFLGYKSKQENDSVQEMIKSLQKSGAKLACFSYNIDEVNSILEAYKQSTVYKNKRPSSFTLEFFDERHYSYTHVDAAQKSFEKRLNFAGIKSVAPAEALEQYRVSDKTAGLLEDNDIKDIILEIKPNYNTESLLDDLSAINTVSRIREGKKYPYIEKCRAVFATPNTVLVKAVNSYISNKRLDFGFPIAITSEDLCVLAWLKTFEQSNTLPQMRLLENVLAAMTPSKELMDAYFSNLENLERQGVITSDDVSLLRVDLFARHELMELTFGEKENLTESVIKEIRKRVYAESVEAGRNEARAEYEKELREKKNRACKRAEKEVEDEFAQKEERIVRVIKSLSAMLAFVFICASIYTFYSQVYNSSVIVFVIMIITTLITIVQGVLPFFKRENWAIRLMKRKLQIRKLEEIDKRKDRYLSLID